MCESSEEYQKKVNARFDEAYARVATQAQRQWDAATCKVAVLSDQHKGRGNGADDFKKCAPSYLRALAYYLENGFELVLLGDVEELWECRSFASISKCYPEVYDSEKQFCSQGRLVRAFGNHDEKWKDASAVQKQLAPLLGNLTVYESLLVKVTNSGAPVGEMLLLHGDQAEDYGWFAHNAVRYLWGPVQRLTGIRVSPTPAHRPSLKKKLGKALHRWASGRQEFILVAGHTHHEVFLSQSPKALLERDLEEIRDARAKVAPDEPAAKALATKAMKRQRDLDWLQAKDPKAPAFETDDEQPKPCYFNTGCCSFGNGAITGIEIAGGDIRLVGWSDEVINPEQRVILRSDLLGVYAQL